MMRRRILDGGELSPHDAGFKLNGIWLSSLARGTSDIYRKPREVFKEMLNSVAPRPETDGG